MNCHVRLAASLTIVLALSACGGSNGSDSGFQLPQTSTLSTPVQVIAPGGNRNGVPLNWSPVPDAQAYAIYRCQVPVGVTQDLVAAVPVEGCGAPIAVTTVTSYTDVPPQTAPIAYVYHVRACADIAGQVCGPVLGSVAAAQAIAAPVQPMSTVIGDDGRQVISGLSTTLHAFADGATGTVTWSWMQESGPRVTLVDADTASPSFTAPNVSVNTLLSFELRVTDDNGPGRTSKAAVTVVPAANVIVKAGHEYRLVQPGHLVSLHARGSEPGLSYAWRQLSPEQPVVTLSGATTSNPSFVAPSTLAGAVLRFEVTATDPVTGRNASASTAVEVQGPIPVLTPIATPTPAPGQVPTLVPVAAPLLVPLLLAHPLQVPQANQTAPVPNPVLVPPLVPPQALVLTAAPTVVATGGTQVQLAMAATGGRLPYQWTWTQTSGPTAVLSGTSSEVLTVDVPTVTTAQTLTFEASLTDANGTQRTAQAVVQATLPPQAVTGVPARLQITSLEPRLVVADGGAQPIPVLVVPALTDVTVTQTDGVQLQVAQQTVASSTGATTVITVQAPLQKDDSTHASLTVRGRTPTGEPLTYIVPILLLRPPGLAPAPTNPPQVLPPQQVPRQDDPLVFAALQTSFHMSEGSPKRLGVVVRGGRGTAAYRYQWTYLQDPGGPDLVITGATTQRAGFDAPAVDRPTLVRFRIQVTDGAQTIEREVVGQIDDLAPTLLVGTLSPLSAQDGDVVTVNSPSARGGVMFPHGDHYHYQIRQVSGPTVTLTPVTAASAERVSNWTFPVPSLAPGAPDAVLEFEITVLDRVGNAAVVMQEVVVNAPPLPAALPLLVKTVVPGSVNYTNAPSLQLQATATGGRAPFSYAWTIAQSATPRVNLATGAPVLYPPFVLPDLQATGPNPTVPFSLGARYGESASYTLTVTLRVTDADGTVVTVGSHPVNVKTDLGRPGSETLTCGNLDRQEQCTDLDLVLAMTEKCPDATPYAMNDIIKISDQVLEFRRCVNAGEAYRLWYVETRNNPRCRIFDPSATGDVTCHLACYGDDCNIETIPKDNVLVGPPGPDGLLTVGVPPLPRP